jgi:hypothetical protein
MGNWPVARTHGLTAEYLVNFISRDQCCLFETAPKDLVSGIGVTDNSENEILSFFERPSPPFGCSE